MPTVIRLTRMGKKKRPFYRLVVLDSRKRRDGAYLANLGYYNPFVEPPEVELHGAEICDWLGKGAQVSETVRALLKREGVLYRFSLIRQGLGEDEVARKMEEWRPAAEARAERHVEAVEARQRQIDTAERERRDEKAKAAEAAAAAENAPAEGEGEAESAPAEEGEET